MRVDKKHGKESATEYRLLQQFRGYAFLELRPRTGRMHQIRVHLNAIGLPVVADPLYGEGKPFFLSEIKVNYRAGEEAEKPLLSRTALHARSLSVTHSTTGERVTWTAEIPKDIRSVLRALEKYGV